MLQNSSYSPAQSSPPLVNRVHCSHPGSSIPLKIKQCAFRKQRAQRMKTQPHRLCKSQTTARSSPASVKVAQNMQIAIYCSCPQDSDTKDNFAGLAATELMKPFQVCSAYIILHKHVYWEKGIISAHVLPKRVPNLGLCKLTGNLGQWERRRLTQLSVVPEVQCSSTQNKLI